MGENGSPADVAAPANAVCAPQPVRGRGLRRGPAVLLVLALGGAVWLAVHYRELRHQHDAAVQLGRTALVDSEPQFPPWATEICRKAGLPEPFWNLKRAASVACYGGPIDLAQVLQLKRLRRLVLEDAEFDASLIPRVAALPELRTLIILRGSFSARQIEAIERWPRLNSVALGGSDLTDAVLERVVLIPGLEWMAFEGTVTDAGLDRISRCRTLRGLALRRAAVSARGLSALRACPVLEQVSLADMPVSAGMLRTLQALPRLASLDLSGAPQLDALADELSRFSGVRRLQLRRAALSDGGLLELRRMEALEELDLSGTRVTDVGEAAFRKARPDVRVVREPEPQGP